MAANKTMESALVRLMLLEGKGKPNNKSSQSTQKKAKPKQKAVPEKKAQPEPKIIVAQKDQPKPKTERKDTPKAAHEKKAEAVAKPKSPSVFTTVEAAKPPAVSEPEATSITTENTESKEKSPALPEMKVVSLTGQNDMDTVEAVSEEALEVDKLEIWKQSGERSVRFQFSLKNVSATGKKIKGYTFVVLKAAEGSAEPSRGSPWTPLEDGQPTIFKRGQYFSIARFKYVRGKIPQIQDVERFKTATIYVYTETGNLLIEKVFDVADILRS
jgi:hypothetical protein